MISIYIKDHQTGEKHQIRLTRQPEGRRFDVTYNGRPSEKLPAGTISDISNGIRRLLINISGV